MEQRTTINQGTAINREEDVFRGKAAGYEAAGKQEPGQCRIRRVGSVTFGITLVCYGILFLLHIFMPMLKYNMIFKCWPVIFILLGGEILIENYRCKTKEWKMVYDFAAILMLGAMLLFAMVMAVIDYAMAYGPVYF